MTPVPMQCRAARVLTDLTSVTTLPPLMWLLPPSDTGKVIGYVPQGADAALVVTAWASALDMRMETWEQPDRVLHTATSRIDGITVTVTHTTYPGGER